MNVPLKLCQTFVGFGVVGLVVAGAICLPTSSRQQVVRVVSPVENQTVYLPIVPPIVSSEGTSGRSRQAVRTASAFAEAPPTNLSTTAGVDVKAQPARPNSNQIALTQTGVAVSLSRAQLAQSRINLVEFQAKHNNTKILYRQGKVSRQQVNTAKSAHKLMQLQHSSASIGLQESMAQLIAAKAKVIELGRNSNP